MNEKRIVTCSCRTYNIISGGSIIDIATSAPLKGRTPDEMFEELLKEYEEVTSFFSKFSLLKHNGHKAFGPLPLNITNVETGVDIPLVSPEDVLEGLEGSHGKREKDEVGIRNVSGKGIKGIISKKDDEPTITVLRLNNMIRIKEEFTRSDYQNSLKNIGFDISKYVGYDDIGRALALRRIKRVGRIQERGKAFRYKVINDKTVAQREYSKMMQGKRTRKK